MKNQASQIATFTKLYPEAEYSEYGSLKFFTRTNEKGQPCLTLWKGKKHAPYHNYRFIQGEKALIEFMIDVIKREDKDMAQKEEAKTKRANKGSHPFSVDDVFYDSWGYDQTNIDYYQVTRATEKSIWIRGIGKKLVSSHEYSSHENVTCVRNDWKEEKENLKRVQWMGRDNEDGGFYIKSDYGWMSRVKEGSTQSQTGAMYGR